MTSETAPILHCDREFALRVESLEVENQRLFAETHQRLRADSDTAFVRIGTGGALFAGGDSPLTQAFGIGLNGEVSLDEVLAMEEFFFSRDVAANVEVSHLADMSLFEHLVNRDYRITELSNVLVKRLERPSNSAARQMPSLESIAIRQVREPEFAEAARIISGGFFGDETPPDGFVELFTTWWYQPNAACFVAETGGAFVGGGSMTVFGDVIALAGASVLPAFRGRGIQTALLHSRLNMAMEQGCTLAMVSTAPGSVSQRTMENQGFQIAYTRTKFTKARA